MMQSQLVHAVARVRPALVSIVVFHDEQDYVAGAGVFLTPNIVATNFCLIEGQERVEVAICTGEKLTARVLGSFEDHDTTFLQVEGQHAVAELRESCCLLLGETAFAVSCPYGYEVSISAGVISGLRREVRVLSMDKVANLIQTDAALCPGYETGPLFDGEGKLIGLVVELLHGIEGTALALPAEQIARLGRRLDPCLEGLARCFEAVE